MSIPMQITLFLLNTAAAFIALQAARKRKALGHDPRTGYILVGLHTFLATLSLLIITYDIVIGLG